MIINPCNSKIRREERWIAELRANNQVTYIGRFIDKEKAAIAYQQKRNEILGVLI